MNEGYQDWIKGLAKTVYPVVPPKTEYNLTEYGKTLTLILLQMCSLGEEYMGDQIKSNII